MKKILKIVGLTVAAILLLMVITAVGIMTFVSPNRFKPILTAQVLKYTGRQVTIDGDLSWTFFPTVGVKTGHLALSNPAGFQQPLFAEIQRADISVRLLPLLRNKIESNGMTLHGLKLFLITNKQGQKNWMFTSDAAQKTPGATHDAATSAPVSALQLAIAGIDVEDGEVQWIDEQNKQSARINEFELHANEISFVEPFPINMRFTFASEAPALKGIFKLKSNIALNLSKQIFALRALQIDADVQQEKKHLEINLTGDVNADLAQQKLHGSDLQISIGDMKLTGQLDVTHLTSQPQTKGHLHLAPVDMRAWLKAMGQDVATLQTFKMVAGDIDLTSANNVAALQGKLTVDEIEANHVKLTQLVMPLQWRDKVLTLSNVTANLYQGGLQATTTVNLQSPTPQIKMNAKLNQIQIKPLLDDLGGDKRKISFSGATQIDFQVTTAGMDAAAVLKNLNGSGHLTVNNGTIEGIDLRYYINMAKALLAQKAPSGTNTNKTEFANLTASTTIKNGVVQNDDLLVTSSLFTSKGKGNIDLVNQQINYRLDTLVNKTGAMEDTGWADVSKVTIPVDIRGSLSDPSIRLDSSGLTKSVADTVIEKTKADLQKKLEKQGGALLQNLLGH